MTSAPLTPDSRERLLAATIEHVASNGVGQLSLRGLAAAIGTSHRMLLYHFGSREGLFIEVIRAMEASQRAALADLDLDLPLPEAIRQMWQRLADPALWPHERLFFEMYGQALQGYPAATPMLEGVVDSWLEVAAQLALRHGLPAETARAQARLGLAVVRGLLLDLLATGDRAGVDAAMDAYIASFTPPAHP
jgi:AcrR family transcriptional regulator